MAKTVWQKVDLFVMGVESPNLSNLLELPLGKGSARCDTMQMHGGDYIMKVSSPTPKTQPMIVAHLA